MSGITHCSSLCSGAALSKGTAIQWRWDCHAEHASSGESLIRQICKESHNFYKTIFYFKKRREKPCKCVSHRVPFFGWQEKDPQNRSDIQMQWGAGFDQYLRHLTIIHCNAHKIHINYHQRSHITAQLIIRKVKNSLAWQLLQFGKESFHWLFLKLVQRGILPIRHREWTSNL